LFSSPDQALFLLPSYYSCFCVDYLLAPKLIARHAKNPPRPEPGRVSAMNDLIVAPGWGYKQYQLKEFI